jgi:uncharacterized lipoprotein YajG
VKKTIIASIFCISALSLTGCAFTQESVDLQYIQQANVVKIKGAENVTVNVAIVDQRTDKTKISSKKNGFGMETAPITANEDVTITIRKAIETELQSRGFLISSNSAIVDINAELDRFYNDHKTGFMAGDAVADLEMNVSVKSKSGKVVYTSRLVAQGVEANTQLMTGENAKKALDKALSNGMTKLFLITIETQPASTGVVALEPFESRL